MPVPSTFRVIHFSKDLTACIKVLFVPICETSLQLAYSTPFQFVYRNGKDSSTNKLGHTNIAFLEPNYINVDPFKKNSFLCVILQSLLRMAIGTLHRPITLCLPRPSVLGKKLKPFRFAVG